MGPTAQRLYPFKGDKRRFGGFGVRTGAAPLKKPDYPFAFRRAVQDALPEAPLSGDLVLDLLTANKLLLQKLVDLQTQVLHQALIRDPVGEIYSLEQRFTSAQWQEFKFDPPLFTILITNAGPGIIEYRIPYGQTDIGIVRAGSSKAFNFPIGVIRTLGLRCRPVSGGTPVPADITLDATW